MMKGSVAPNMFNQILQFLSFKDEIVQGYEEGNQQSFFMRQMPSQDIQKVIFDKNYLKFIKNREKSAEGILNTTGYVNNQSQPLTPEDTMADPTQMNRLQYVQYECIKTELKEEYEKRVNFLQRRIEKRQSKQGPYQDAHLIL
jgi:hypothetical protein